MSKKLSVCVIARNEAKSLPGMIESIRDFADELVIVDTGSTDDTEEVAGRAWARVFKHPQADYWRENPKEFNFADARNYAIEQCTGDWILSLDCDEQVAPGSGKKIRRIVDEISEEVDLILITMVMCKDDGTPYQRFLAERLLRNKPTVRFSGEMHNWVTVPPDNSRIGCPDIEILHNRAYRNQQARGERANQRMAMAENWFPRHIEKDDHAKRSMFYLAGTHFDGGNREKGLEWFEKYLQTADWPEEQYQAGYLLGQLYAEKGRIDDAKKVLATSLAHNWKRSECLVWLGKLAYQQGDLEQAEWWFKIASLKPMPIDPLFVEIDAHTWLPHVGLWQVYADQRRVEDAARHAEEAMRLGAEDSGPMVKWMKNHSLYGDERILCLVDRGQCDFIQPLIDEWVADGPDGSGFGNKQVTVIDALPESFEADVVWAEWAGPEFVKLTQREKAGRIIVRIHGYEVNTDCLNQANWANVDDVIFVQEELKDTALEMCPAIGQFCNIYVVPGGVECDKFSIGGEKQGNKIAMLGYCNARKGLPLALQVLVTLPPKYQLHVAGEWQDFELLRYVQALGVEMGLEGRLFLYGRVEDRNAWLADKDFILSTSVRETMHYAVGEGMSAGLCPVVHAWDGARKFYPQECIWKTVNEAVRIIEGTREPEKYREYAFKRLNIETNRKRIGRILNKTGVTVCGEPKSKDALEYRIARELEALGCRHDGPDPKVVILVGHAPRLEPWMKNTKKILLHGELVLGDSEKAVNARALIADLVPKVALVLCPQANWTPAYEAMGAKAVDVCHMGGVNYPWRKLDGVEKKRDIGFYGYITERRACIFNELESQGLKVEVCESRDHEELNRFINESRVAINVHAYDVPLIEYRLGECMGAGACIVSEPLGEGYPFPEDTFIQTDDLVGTIKKMLADEAECEAMGNRACDWVWREYTMKQCVEKLLDLAGV